MTHDDYPIFPKDNEQSELEKLHQDVKNVLIKYRLLERRWERYEKEEIEEILIAISQEITAIEAHSIHEDLEPIDLLNLAYLKQAVISSRARLGMV